MNGTFALSCASKTRLLQRAFETRRAALQIP